MKLNQSSDSVKLGRRIASAGCDQCSIGVCLVLQNSGVLSSNPTELVTKRQTEN
jgi:hypothetical protein